MKNPLQNLPVRAVRLALGALFASLAALAPSAAAHAPEAVDPVNGTPCIQVDCASDKITNRCGFAVQTTHRCKGDASHCGIDSSSIFNSALENGVTVVGANYVSTKWTRHILRTNAFYPMGVSRKVAAGGDRREGLEGFGCAIHTDGSVTSAGSEWRKDEEGNSVLACVHTHTDGAVHVGAASRARFECRGERINNWAAECVEYLSVQNATLNPDGTTNFEPSGHAEGTYLVNKCKCPVVLDSCHGKHPCHQDVNRRVVLQPGEDSFVAALPGSEASWAACYKDENPQTEDLKSAGENLWACGEGQTACSEIVAAADDSAGRLQFAGMSRAETAAPEATAEAQEAGGPTDDSCKYANDGVCSEPEFCPRGTDTTDCSSRRGEEVAEAQETADQPENVEEDPLAALRGTPPPTGTKTEKFLRKEDVWGGQLDVNAKVKPEGWTANVSHLSAAAHENDMEAAGWLIANGADVNARSDVNAKTDGTTPLHYAASKNAAEVAKLLIAKGADVNAKNKRGFTPLHIAAYRKAAEAAKVLIDEGADINAKDDDGDTPLHMAAYKNAAEAAKLLIDEGAEVNAKNNVGGTPLDRARKENAAAVAKVLIANGATN